MTRKFYLEGNIYGILEVIKYENKKYLCKCKCGKEVNLFGTDLRNNCYSSCGCRSNRKVNKIYGQKYEEKSKKRFFKFVEKTENCWTWKGSLSTFGYARIAYKGKNCVASRLIWKWENGEIPKNIMVCHKCDNRKCVNPDHLFLGTQKDNMQDMLKKGRWEYHRDKMKKNTLTPEKVREIRKDLSSGMYMKEIAKKFSMCVTSIENIKYGISWKFVS